MPKLTPTELARQTAREQQIVIDKITEFTLDRMLDYALEYGGEEAIKDAGDHFGLIIAEQLEDRMTATGWTQNTWGEWEPDHRELPAMRLDDVRRAA